MQSQVCEPILRLLPDWFGIEEANQNYLKEINNLPTFLALHEDNVVGFLTIKQHFPHAAELFIVGILPDLHRQGIGKKLLHQVEAYLRVQQVEYLQVKTLSETHPDPNYARTRKFYISMGFRPLEVFPQLWDEANPCLLLVKRL